MEQDVELPEYTVAGEEGAFSYCQGTLFMPIVDALAAGDNIGTYLDTLLVAFKMEMLNQWNAAKGLLTEVKQ